jgi:FAD/FMN-containing dehydrogenase
MKKSVCFAACLCVFGLQASLLWVPKPQRAVVVVDKTWLTSVRVKKIKKPKTIDELQQIVRDAQEPISIIGAGYAQGGQIAYPGGLAIDMTLLNAITKLDIPNKRITVQAGATWRAVQQYIDPHNLSVRVMQSYNDFTVGGALSVNVHARDLAYGPIINTVESIELLLADGSIVHADRQNNTDLFCAAIGGYGLVGIIVQVTLELTENNALEYHAHAMAMDDFAQQFQEIYADDCSVFNNTEVYPPAFTHGVMITWRKTKKALTNPQRFQTSVTKYLGPRTLELLVRHLPSLHHTRPWIHQTKGVAPQVVRRNYEMSYTIGQLAMHTQFPTTMTLQEYFVPIDKIQQVLVQFRILFAQYGVNVLNFSIRHVPQDTTSIMAYARQESFACVLYISILNTQHGREYACMWTQKLIDKILELGGSYYLPYLLCATREQFNAAYPDFKQLVAVKQNHDPTSKFKNMLWQQYA